MVEPRYDFGTFGSMTRLSIFQPWKVTLQVSRITPGTDGMTGRADASNTRDGFRWERQGNVRHHADKMFLDDVIVYVGDTDQVWGTGTVGVYLVEPAAPVVEPDAAPSVDERPFMCGTCGFEASGDRDTRDAAHLKYDGAHYASWWRNDEPEGA